MQKVKRSEILDYQTYQDQKSKLLPKILEIKAQHRIQIQPYFTFLFETQETIWYQIQEMMRLEKMVREQDILHEIETYNELLGDEGELGCTLLIEIDDVSLRDQKLREWVNLTQHIYVASSTGEKAYARYDQRQVGTDRLSAVQYLKFKLTKNSIPIKMGIDAPVLKVETELSSEQQKTLAADLAS